jgi:arginyl-tRNA synthetase
MLHKNLTIENNLIKLIKSACNTIWGTSSAEVQLQITPKEYEGDYTFIAFSLSKEYKSSPESIGLQIGEWIYANSNTVKNFNVVKGFLNISLADKVWLDQINSINNPQLAAPELQAKTIVVEFSSPNTNKPLHLGHLRNNFLGQSIVRILQAVGHTVHSVCVVNDRGIHICKSMVAYKHLGCGDTPQSSGMKGDAFVGKYYILFDKQYKEEIAILEKSTGNHELAEQQAPIMLEAQELLRLWEQHDPETIDLWNKMNAWVYSGFETTYKKIGITFDKIYYESQTYLLGKEIVYEGLEKKNFYKKEDGSIWIDLTKEKLDHKVLIRKDGTSVYITQDLGMADLRYQDFKFDRSIYVVGNEQDYHFDVLFKILNHLNRDYANNLYHLSYGMVDLPSGKMKSREGTVVDADDLIKTVETIAEDHTKRLGKANELSAIEAKKLYSILAMGALKYQILKVDPQKRILFDPTEAIDFQGNTGPFIQYTYARICSIFTKAASLGIEVSTQKSAKQTLLHKLERDVLIQLYRYNQILHDAAEKLAPSTIAQYIFDLCKNYNRMYAELSILHEEDISTKTFRLMISKLVEIRIKKCMYLLGIEVPERM